MNDMVKAIITRALATRDRELNNNNNNNNLLQLGCHPMAVVILHVYKI